jgi:hypothetical protein
MHTSGYLLLFRRQETAEDGTDVENSSHTQQEQHQPKRKQKKQKVTSVYHIHGTEEQVKADGTGRKGRWFIEVHSSPSPS